MQTESAQDFSKLSADDSSTHPLRNRKILIVEDEYMLADDLRAELVDAHAVVLGPVGSVADAMALIKAEEHIDGAFLDLNLRGEMTYMVADLLVERGVDFVFTTGYDESSIPIRFKGVVRCKKPTSVASLVRGIACPQRTQG